MKGVLSLHSAAIVGCCCCWLLGVGGGGWMLQDVAMR